MPPVQTPIGLFHLLTTGLRLQGFINKFLVIWDGEVLNHNYVQTQVFISYFALVFLMLFGRWEETSILTIKTSVPVTFF